ncbi:MAG TPA: septation protein IspZ, partial [Burkholderiales bacterium]
MPGPTGRPPGLGHLLFALYPILIFAGLEYLDPRTVGACVLAALVLRYRRRAAHLLSGFSAVQLAALALPVVLGIAVVATNDETLLRMYPASISASMLLLFGATLVRPPTMVERFARMQEPDLPPERVRYTRRVTEAWCLFFVLNGGIAAYTAAFSSRETWAIYTGFVSYLLMGALFVAERIVRRRTARMATPA